MKVNGERNPTEVYNDFRSSILQILSAHKSSIPADIPNGTAVHSNKIAVHQNQENTQNPGTDTGENNHVTNQKIAEYDSQPVGYPRIIFVVGKSITFINILSQHKLNTSFHYNSS